MLDFGLQPGRPTPVLMAARTPPPQAAAPIEPAARAPEPVRRGAAAPSTRPGAARVPRRTAGRHQRTPQPEYRAPEPAPEYRAAAQPDVSHGAASASDRRRPATGPDASRRGPRGQRPRSAGGGSPGGTHGAGAARLRAGGGQSASQSPGQSPSQSRRISSPTTGTDRPTRPRPQLRTTSLRTASLDSGARSSWTRIPRRDAPSPTRSRRGAYRREAASDPQARNGRRGGGCCRCCGLAAGADARRKPASTRGRSEVARAWRNRGPRSPVVPRCEDPDRIGAILGRSAESRGGRSHDGTRVVAHAERDAHADHAHHDGAQGSRHAAGR